MPLDMDVVIGARGAGKTTEALTYLKNNPGTYLVVARAQRAQQLKAVHGALADRIVHIGPENDPLIHVPARADIIIDDADEIFQRLFRPHAIKIITMTGARRRELRDPSAQPPDPEPDLLR